MSASKAARQRAAELDLLVERLRDAGLRRTAPRVAVLERLAQAEAPLSHAEMADALAPLGFDRATVFRNLTDLAGAGLVTRRDLGDHVWRFALSRDGEAEHGRQHPHLLCSDCGTVVCLPDVAVKITPARGRKRVAQMEVQLKGLCDRCDG
jgi:Fur family ferric uptake transcriptional regulator